MEHVLPILLSVIGVSLVSLIGAVGLSFGALRRHSTMMFLIALAAGTLIGDTFFHILPEASHDGFDAGVGALVIGGFVLLFLLEIGLRWQHSHAEHLDHDHDDDHHSHHVQPFGWLNLVGDAVHNLLDGIIIAAAYMVDIPLGIATTIAVLLHEVPQELGDFAVLVRSGFSTSKALLVNLATALFALLGAALVLLSGLDAETITAFALPLVAGAFLYIAAADLIPELHHHTIPKERAIVLIGFVVGLLAMWALTGLEGALFADDHGHQH